MSKRFHGMEETGDGGMMVMEVEVCQDIRLAMFQAVLHEVHSTRLSSQARGGGNRRRVEYRE